MGMLYKPVGSSGFPFDFVNDFIRDGYICVVETGTYRGQTSKELSKIFKKVITIEAFDEVYQEALVTLRGIDNITPVLGDSREKLPQILDELKDSKVIFWLDAHYSGNGTFNSSSPLVAELQLINASKLNDPIIVIDDARLILSEVEGEENNSRYATLTDFIYELSKSNRYISHVGDKFIAVPNNYKNILNAYTTEKNAEDIEFLKNYNKTMKFFKKYNSSLLFRIKSAFRKNKLPKLFKI